MTRVRQGHTLTELGEHLRLAALEHPTITRCLWCDWHHHGTAEQCMEQARQHRVEAHGVRVTSKRRHRPANAPVLAGDLEVNIANARAQGAAAWMDTAA